MPERLGIVGGGQLGRMQVEPAKSFGFDVMVLQDGEGDCPAAQLGAKVMNASIMDGDAVRRLVEICDFVTIEVEHIAADALLEKTLLHDETGEGALINPRPETMLMIQDKLVQKQFLESKGIPVAPYTDSMQGIGLGNGPYMIKTRRGAFDGRGNSEPVRSLMSPEALEFTGKYPEGALYVEEMVPFEKELAVIAARDMQGTIAMYPVYETVHENNICKMVTFPAQVESGIAHEAETLAYEVMDHMQGAGVFAIEMFLTDKGPIVNEIAPRVHNSGHLTTWTNETSQFEQHVRAVTGMPLGGTQAKVGAAVMVNILGTKEGPLDMTGRRNVLNIPNVHMRMYGKTPRGGRKIGDLTLTGNETDALSIYQMQRQALAVRELLTEL